MDLEASAQATPRARAGSKLDPDYLHLVASRASREIDREAELKAAKSDGRPLQQHACLLRPEEAAQVGAQAKRLGHLWTVDRFVAMAEAESSDEEHDESNSDLKGIEAKEDRAEGGKWLSVARVPPHHDAPQGDPSSTQAPGPSRVREHDSDSPSALAVQPRPGDWLPDAVANPPDSSRNLGNLRLVVEAGGNLGGDGVELETPKTGVKRKPIGIWEVKQDGAGEAHHAAISAAQNVASDMHKPCCAAHSWDSRAGSRPADQDSPKEGWGLASSGPAGGLPLTVVKRMKRLQSVHDKDESEACPSSTFGVTADDDEDQDALHGSQRRSDQVEGANSSKPSVREAHRDNHDECHSWLSSLTPL